ncbi:copper amine oxidase N-terminal domain-containing protein [Paenibacillus sp. MWE-103]|uniref:Copper amine oxidase N-terminal domain-containing protein n=1 Tax=Paenibacillus artemisiicola TaxID=1172618 RepID=A0ABS3W8E2_9BACL|nr:copper amine oxidase N-terminal domain-containing protein [Paenibacillus artemisiicola]MBO7744400.1 copper amine oxidase N-terminal domain-containing protein [Paenibacillus artemisiicola]
MKRLLSAFLCMVSFFCFSQLNNVSAAASTSTSSLPTYSHVYLKAGPYYILYAHPTAPFVDQHNRLLIPVRAFDELFGGSVSYQASNKTAEVIWQGHTYKFVVGSEKAEVDGRTFSMDTKPVIKDGSISLPIRLFLNTANLKYHWDNELRVLVLDDERILVGEPFMDFKGNDLCPDNIDNALQVEHYSIKKLKEGNFQLNITARNKSGNDIPAGKADIHPLVSFGKVYGGFSTDSYSRPVYPALAEVKSGKEITVTQNFPLEDVQYIITVARIFS